MSEQSTPRLVGLSMHHPDRAPSYARLTIDRRLRGGKLDDVPLTEDDLVNLLVEAASCLKVLRARR